MNEFEKSVLQRVGKEKYERITNTLVGIIGCGGLGSNAASYLVRSGFRRFIIMDFDTIDYSNLNRQFYFYEDVGKKKTDVLKEHLMRINPDIEVEMLCGRLDRDNINIFRKVDVLIEAVDIAGTKADIVSFGAQNGIFTVSSSGMAGYGDGKDMTVKKIGGVYITGDMKSGISPDLHPYAPKVAIAAALEADIVLKYVMDS